MSDNFISIIEKAVASYYNACAYVPYAYKVASTYYLVSTELNKLSVSDTNKALELTAKALGTSQESVLDALTKAV